MGNCVKSPQFPSQYGNSQACSIAVGISGYVSSTAFNTEAGFDKLIIGSQTFHGNQGPSNQAVTAGSTISWQSDSSVVKLGWVICVSASSDNGSGSASGSVALSGTGSGSGSGSGSGLLENEDVLSMGVCMSIVHEFEGKGCCNSRNFRHDPSGHSECGVIKTNFNNLDCCPNDRGRRRNDRGRRRGVVNVVWVDPPLV